MKKTLALLMALAMIFSLAIAGTAYADDADDFHIDLTYSNVFNPAEWNYKAAELFAEAVTERTEGHITVTFHGLNELDCYADSLVHAYNGDNWIGLEEPSLFAEYVGDCAVLAIHSVLVPRAAAGHLHPLARHHRPGSGLRYRQRQPCELLAFDPNRIIKKQEKAKLSPAF